VRGLSCALFCGFATICSVEDYLGELVQRNFVDCWGNNEFSFFFFFYFFFFFFFLLLLLPPTWVSLRVIGPNSFGRTGWSFLFPSLLQGPPPKCLFLIKVEFSLFLNEKYPVSRAGMAFFFFFFFFL
jgi:hypothetical protein